MAAISAHVGGGTLGSALRYTKPDLLIIDDLGLRPLHHDQPMNLCDVISQRYERGSIIVTSNRHIGKWPPLFHDPLLASAALDWLLHHGHVVATEASLDRETPRQATFHH